MACGEVGSGGSEWCQLSVQLLRGRAYLRQLCIFEVPLGLGAEGWEVGEVDGANFPFSCFRDGPLYGDSVFLRSPLGWGREGRGAGGSGWCQLSVELLPGRVPL